MQTLTWPILTMLPRSSLARSNRASPIGRSFRCERPGPLVEPGDRYAIRARSPPYFNERHAVDEAVGENEVAARRHRGVAHDIAATRNGPALEFLRLRIEAHDRVRRRAGLAVPDDVVDGRDAVGLGLRPARGRPLGHLAGRRIEPAEIAARIVRVPD